MDGYVMANAALAAGVFLAFALPGLLKRDAWRWVPVVFVIALLDSVTTLLPFLDRHLQFPGLNWNWTGKLLNIAAMLLMSVYLIASQRMTAKDIGLTPRQAPGTGRALVTVILPYLAVFAALTLAMLGSTKPPSRETLAYQATMPGLAEELSYRGVQLAIFNKMFTGRFRLFGAEIGYGAIAISMAFGVLHGLGFDKAFHLQMSPLAAAFTGSIGFVLAWLRERSKSLALPVVLHNVTNLIHEVVPRIL